MPKPKRPSEAPASATFDVATRLWVDGAQSAHERHWDQDGVLLLELHRQDGKLHGPASWQLRIDDEAEYAPRVALHEKLELPSGPTTSFRATYDQGLLSTVEFFVLDTVALRAQLKNGLLDGPLWWLVSADSPVFAYRGVSIAPKLFKVPKPWPHAISAVFSKGKLKSSTPVDDEGVANDAPPPPKLTDFGQDISSRQLAKYVASGDFESDAKRFFPSAKAVDASELSAKRVKALERLPKAHQTSAKALHALVRDGLLPAMPLVFDLSSWGFDCAANKLDGATDANYFGASSTGSGDMYLLDLSSGSVTPWGHEGEGVMVKQAFSSLDVYAFALLRIEAVVAGLLPKAKVNALFKKLKLAPAVFALRQACELAGL